MDPSVHRIEAHFGITLPARHRAALLDPGDPIHDRKDLLTPDGNEVTNIFGINRDMRGIDWKEWPDWLVAFASNNCGDYFAYDTRAEPHRVYYIGPTNSAPEAIAGCEAEGFVFSCFDDWYAYALSRHRA